MFSSDPFQLLTQFLPPVAMQVYVALMALAVVLGTVADLRHKRSAEFFAARRRQAKAAARRTLGAGELAALALRTLGNEVATAGEFCQWGRRLSHILTAYGFVFYLVATVGLVYACPGAAALAALWDLGALMVVAGGAWFFFLQRVDVAHEGRPALRLMRADLFVVSLTLSAAFGLAWHLAEAAGCGAAATLVLFAVYLLCNTVLFVSVPWSKFAHMFYKPAAAFQTRVEEASGASDLPRPAAGSQIVVR